MFKIFAYINFNYLDACKAEDTVVVSVSRFTRRNTVSRSSFSVHIVQTFINVHLQILAHPLSVANAVFMTGAIISLIEPCVYDFVPTYYS